MMLTPSRFPLTFTNGVQPTPAHVRVMMGLRLECVSSMNII